MKLEFLNIELHFCDLRKCKNLPLKMAFFFPLRECLLNMDRSDTSACFSSLCFDVAPGRRHVVLLRCQRRLARSAAHRGSPGTDGRPLHLCDVRAAVNGAELVSFGVRLQVRTVYCFLFTCLFSV